MYKRYYSPFEEEPITKPSYQEERPEPKNIECVKKEDEKKAPSKKAKDGLFGALAIDDLILIGILFLLLTEDKENRDLPLILGIGFLLLVEYIES